MHFTGGDRAFPGLKGNFILSYLLFELQLPPSAQKDLDTEIVRALFQELDQDQSGRISLEEFVTQYFQQQLQVQLRIEELAKMIVDDNKKRAEIVSKLEEISAVEQINEYGIMNNSVLTATIVEARGIKRSNTGYKVFLTTEN